MNTGHRWTRDEDEYIREAADYGTFNRAYPDISFDAYRFRKARLLREEAESLELPPVKVIERGEGPEEFVGLTIAYFDLETTYSSQPRILCASLADAWGRTESLTLHTNPGDTWLDDGPLADAIARRLEDFDIVVSWNGKLFDQPVLNGRLAFHSLRQWEPRLHIDAMYLASGNSMRIGRRSLDSVSKFFGAPIHKTPLDVQIWDRADHGSEDDYRLIVEHCEADVLVLRETFGRLKRQIKNIHR